MEKESFIVRDEIVKKVIAKLLNKSTWFEVDPLIDGGYAISVKASQSDWMNKTVSKLGA